MNSIFVITLGDVFTLAMIGFGVFFIAFCYGYKWWTLRKFKK